MDTVIGKVVNVFLPDDENIINPQNIGFEVFVGGKNLKIVVPVDEETASILKNDNISIIRQVIDNKVFYSVEKVDKDE